MQASFRSVALAVSLFSSAAVCSEDALDRAVRTYVPGKLVSTEQFEALGDAFLQLWASHKPAEKALAALQKGAEPEALLAMIVLLREAEPTIHYGSFTAPQDTTKKEIRSMDGLLGFRVVYQTERAVGKSKRLLSGIFSYDLLPDGGFRLREDLDTARIRVEMEPFEAATAEKQASGFLGFSWNSSFDKEKALHFDTQPVFTDAAKAKGDEHNVHAGMRKPGVTPCAFPAHCNTCHHAERRSFFDGAELPEMLSEYNGAKGLRRYLEKQKFAAAAREKTEAAMEKAEEGFPRKTLLTALEARWRALYGK